jgi:hypothetical protein
MKVLKKIKIFHIMIILVCGISFIGKGIPVYGDEYVKVWDSGSAIPNPLFDVAVGDTDKDGKPEIIVADISFSGAKIYVFENTGDNSYQLVWDSGTILTMFFCYIEVGDQDKDGKVEIIALEKRHDLPLNGKLHVFENNGDNTYEEVWNNGNAFNGIEPSALFLGDADDDGKHEIIVGTGWGFANMGKIYVFENTGDDTYENVWNSGSFLSDSVMPGAVGDLDEDGKREIIVGSGDLDSQVHVFENTGDNSYEGPVWDSGGTFTRAGYANIGDQDSDGKAEIIASGGRDKIVHVFENSGDNSYTNVWDSGTLNGNPFLVATGDQDQDGKRELIIPCLDGKVYVFENTGDNTYEEVWNSGSVMSAYVYDVAVGDQDEDGKYEIIAASYDGKIYVFESPISATITVEIDIKPGSWPNHINPRSKGVIPVAILTTSTTVGESIDFDAAAVEPLSVKFGPGEAVEVHGKGHIKDVDNDGDPDMVLHFKTQETGIKSGDTEACLTGKTFDGKSIQACDTIKTKSKEKK